MSFDNSSLRLPAALVQVLDAVESGIDLFDTAYATEMAAAGHALVFLLQPSTLPSHNSAPPSSVDSSNRADEPSLPAAAAEGAEADTRPQGLTSDLADVVHGKDESPLQCGCSCYTCSNYSRAYLHHLVRSEELLASVLLEMHNTHHMQSWFALLRAAVAAGGLGQYAAWFCANCRDQTLVTRRPLADAVPLSGAKPSEDTAHADSEEEKDHYRQEKDKS